MKSEQTGEEETRTRRAKRREKGELKDFQQKIVFIFGILFCSAKHRRRESENKTK